ncbi:uncharacterized protein LOC111395558 isoform X2 [Olea europaea var. sylvestris]|uniref:uncharacterized protein LOC111395558 isoform X2 n=1 Tax=Olea europaea var. sylvestris TaxID=158386 RepID=UPI000C1CFD7A|nr:uncharacterized protein LOC111395558 isoform X2 [Olea europaea var. sylvestris]
MQKSLHFKIKGTTINIRNRYVLPVLSSQIKPILLIKMEHHVRLNLIPQARLFHGSRILVLRIMLFLTFPISTSMLIIEVVINSKLLMVKEPKKYYSED